jgi:hypothetical protein
MSSHVILSRVTRRLRLVLLLAAFVCAGPMPSVRSVDAFRLDVGIAWFSSERIASPRRQPSKITIPGPAVARTAFNAHPAPVLSSALRPHSLFQRPPPLQN